MTLVTLDRLASRYHMLPSNILADATTFDLQVMDIGLRYEHVAEQKRRGTYKKPIPKLSVDEMKDMIARTKK